MSQGSSCPFCWLGSAAHRQILASPRGRSSQDRLRPNTKDCPGKRGHPGLGGMKMSPKFLRLSHHICLAEMSAGQGAFPGGDWLKCPPLERRSSLPSVPYAT